MTIAFLCNEYPPVRHGGIGRVTRDMAEALTRCGHGARVIGISPRKETAPRFQSENGVEIHRIPSPPTRLGWIAARRRVYRTVAAWANAGEIDLVEVPDYEGMAAGWPSLSAPVVARLHGSASYFAVEMGKRPKRTQYLIERASLTRADFLSSSSRYAADTTQSVFGLRSEKVSILYNMTSVPETVFGGPRTPGKAVFSGTLTPKKGVVDLIDAWAVVVEKCPNARLHMYGKAGLADSGASMQDYLVSRLPEVARRTVLFHGHVDRATLRAALQSASVAVFPSHSEAFALAPMEAMAEACPTIYSWRSSGAELIEHGLSGILVDPSNVQDLSGAIIQVLTDPQLAARLGAGGRLRVENEFSQSVIVPKTIEYYLQCIRAFRGVAKVTPFRRPQRDAVEGPVSRSIH